MEFFDNHAHYNDEKFCEDRDEIIKNIYESGVTKFICAGYSLESSRKAVEIAGKYTYIYTIVGISPNDIPGDVYDENLAGKTEEERQKLFTSSLKTVDNQLEEIEKLAINKKNVAIGEIGLDYYWNKENKELQKQVFIKQIELANKLNLPIVIHTRDAVMDTLDILKNIRPTIKPGVFHCCPLNVELVKEALKLGFYISFAGPVTFKNSKNAREVVQIVPLDKMLIETDSPYLAPEPVRGTRNDSRNVRYIAEKIAEFKEVSVESIAEQTYRNAEEAFFKKL
ncbi:MAG: TatD family hydrolase [Clostridia bacterium]|nr:TatD family hydrolase [Clostridia bacterium]